MGARARDEDDDGATALLSSRGCIEQRRGIREVRGEWRCGVEGKEAHQKQ